MACITHCSQDLTRTQDDSLSSYTFSYWGLHFKLALAAVERDMFMRALVRFVIELCQGAPSRHWPPHLNQFRAAYSSTFGFNPCLLVVGFDLMELYPHIQHLHETAGTLQRNALHIAATVGSEPAVEILMDPESQPPISTLVNARSGLGYTPLMSACSLGHVGVVQRLLCYPSIDPHAVNIDQETALHLACRRGHFAIVQALMNHSSYPPLDVTKADRRGRTPLHRASQGHLDIVQLLLGHTREAPLNLNRLKDRDGKTLLHYAADYNGDRSDIVQALLNYPSQPPLDVNARDDEGYKALHLAAQRRNMEIVKELVGRGATLDRRERYGKARSMLEPEGEWQWSHHIYDIESFLLSLPDLGLQGYSLV